MKKVEVKTKQGRKLRINGIVRTKLGNGKVRIDIFVNGQKFSTKVSGGPTRYIVSKRKQTKPWRDFQKTL